MVNQYKLSVLIDIHDLSLYTAAVCWFLDRPGAKNGAAPANSHVKSGGTRNVEKIINNILSFLARGLAVDQVALDRVRTLVDDGDSRVPVHA
jgi:hypothetical protein